MIVRARYKQKSDSPSPICPNLLCVLVCPAPCPSRISVATPVRKINNASQEGVLRPPANLPRRYEAPSPRNQVKVLASPTVGNSLFDCAWWFSPKCQNKSLCCHSTQNKKPGRRRNAVYCPSNKKLLSRIAVASMPISSVNRSHDTFKDGLSFAVLQDISQERTRKRIQAGELNFSCRRVV